MINKRGYRIGAALLPAAIVASVAAGGFGSASAADGDGLTALGVYATPEGEGGSEIVAFDAATTQVYSTNGASNSIDIISILDPSAPTLVTSIALDAYGDGVQSVAVGDGVIAVAVSAADPTDPGSVVIFTTAGVHQATYTVGFLPDMVTFTPDKSKVIVANEGEPVCEAEFDPEGSISIIDLGAGTVANADFNDFDDDEAALKAAGVRIFFPGASVSEDLEPEYVAVNDGGTTAYVTLQENNALAVVDIATATVTDIVPLGYKDHSQAGNGLDPSNEDGAESITTRNVLGMYMPDAIAAADIDGSTYLFTANEGDARDYDCYSEEVRVKDFEAGEGTLVDGVEAMGLAAPYVAGDLADEELGRLKTTTAFPTELDGSQMVPQIYGYGARSFSIWDASGDLVFDSGDDFSQLLLGSPFFNLDEDETDGRSDDKGAEPEAIAVGEAEGRTFAFIGLERSGGIMMYDVSDPSAPEFITYVNTATTPATELTEAASAADISPEGIAFVPAADSPTDNPLLAVSHEVSGTVRLFEVEVAPEPVESTTTTAAPTTTVPAAAVPTTVAPILPPTGSDGESTMALIALALLAMGGGAIALAKRPG